MHFPLDLQLSEHAASFEQIPHILFLLVILKRDFITISRNFTYEILLRITPQKNNNKNSYYEKLLRITEKN